MGERERQKSEIIRVTIRVKTIRVKECANQKFGKYNKTIML